MTCQESQSKQKGTPQDPPPVGFISQIQSTVLQDQMLIESNNQELVSSEVDPSNYITVVEQKISALEVRYKQEESARAGEVHINNQRYA